MIEIIEYVRKNCRKKGEKKGVLYCAVDPNNEENVIVGFSICNVVDRFDYVKGNKCPGFGLSIAEDRAIKWNHHEDYFIQNSFTEDQIYSGEELDVLINPDASKIVEIPPSIKNKLKNFIERSMRYFKDKDFPVWAIKLMNDEGYDGKFQIKYYYD